MKLRIEIEIPKNVAKSRNLLNILISNIKSALHLCKLPTTYEVIDDE